MDSSVNIHIYGMDIEYITTVTSIRIGLVQKVAVKYIQISRTLAVMRRHSIFIERPHRFFECLKFAYMKVQQPR